MSDRTREQILAEARAEKGGYLRGKGWTEPQIAAYLQCLGIGWRPPWWMNLLGREQFLADVEARLEKARAERSAVSIGVSHR